MTTLTRQRPNLAAFAANSSGAMLAVTVPNDLNVGTRIALPGGEKPDALHITLFYFYEDADLTDDQRTTILRLAGSLATEYEPFDVALRGTEVFEENEERPLVAIVASSVLEDYRKRLAVALDLANITYSKDHEYKPHVTLKYLNEEPRPNVDVNEIFTARLVEAWFAGRRVPITFGNTFFTRKVPRHTFKARPKAGQKQRVGSGTWEEKTNRQQRKIVSVFDSWSAALKRDLATRAKNGATLPELSAYLDNQIPKLEERLIEVMTKGVESAVKTVAGDRSELPQVRAKAERMAAENAALVRENLVPHIHEKLSVALALAVPGLIIGGLAVEQQRGVALAIKNATASSRAAPAQYAGGYWVAIFETQRTVGEVREEERTSQGLDIEPVKWNLDPRAEHCKPSPGFFGCPELAGEYPGGWRTLKTVPAGQVTCRGNCRCHLSVKRDGEWRRGIFD